MNEITLYKQMLNDDISGFFRHWKNNKMSNLRPYYKLYYKFTVFLVKRMPSRPGICGSHVTLVNINIYIAACI